MSRGWSNRRKIQFFSAKMLFTRIAASGRRSFTQPNRVAWLCAVLYLRKPPCGIRFPPICMAKGNSQKQSDGSNLDFEAQLWATADKMRGQLFIQLDAHGAFRIAAALLPKLLSGELRVPAAVKG